MSTLDNNALDVATSATNPNLARVAKAVITNYNFDIWQGVKAALAVIACLSLKESDHCLVLIFEGASGAGKSLTCRIVSPISSTTEAYLERVDKFTPASFVSHASNRTKKELAEIDLLPRLKGKTMITKELAPLFRGNEKDLQQNFATITSVLDGDGFQSNSGTHGSRGYAGRFIFNWLGATTPIPEATHRVMSQLGNRLLFYEATGEEVSEDDLMDMIQDYGANDTVEVCRSVANDFIESYFQTRPHGSINPQGIEISSHISRQLARYAKFIAEGRVATSYNEYTKEFQVGQPENPRRVTLLLAMLARGLALIEGRDYVSTDDLEIIEHVAFSSIAQYRRSVLRAVINAKGSLDTHGVELATDTSRPTALKRMEDLGLTRLGKFTPGIALTAPAEITLRTAWTWLLNPRWARDTRVLTGKIPARNPL